MAPLLRNVASSSDARAARIAVSGRVAFAGCIYCLFWALTEIGGVASASEEALAEFDMPCHGEHVPSLVVRVNFASKDYRFQLDTGSDFTTFDIRLAALRGQQVADRFAIYPGRAEHQNAYRAPDGRIGAMRLPPLEVVCRSVDRESFSRAPKVDGILGADALRTCILRLDFDCGKISFLRALPRDPGTRLDLAPKAKSPTVSGVLTGCGSRNFMIDTGFNGEVGLCREDFAALTAAGHILLAGTRPGGTLGGLFRVRVGVLKNVLSVGGHESATVNVMELPDIDTPFETAVQGHDRPFNILGLEYLSRYVVIFDFPRRAVYLKPGASFRALRLADDLVGVRLARDGQHIIVLSVRDGSDAAAHARPGDVLRSINGTPVVGMSDAEVARLVADETIERNLEFKRPARLVGGEWSICLEAAPPDNPVVVRTAESVASNAPDAPTIAETGPEDVTHDSLSRESFINSMGMKLILIPAGEFLMGNDESAQSLEAAFGNQQPIKPEWIAGERPKHRVRITKPFFLGACEVTKREFAHFVEADHYRTDAEKDGKGGFGFSLEERRFSQRPGHTWRSWGVREADSSPVVNISHNDAVAFCRWLSRIEGKHYRLPTEAEWEYACRAGANTRFYNGDEPQDLRRIGNVGDSTPAGSDAWWRNIISAKGTAIFTCSVGRFAPNLFGLYDMTGNVAEWCSDWYGEEYYAHSPLDDPPGPAAGSFRVYRGGSWEHSPAYCRCACRSGNKPSFRNYRIGFRVACER